MKIELHLDTNYKETSEGFPLVFKISHKQNRKRKEIGKCKINHFNNDAKNILTKHPDYDILAPIINDYKITAKKIMLSNIVDVNIAYDMMFNSISKSPEFLEAANEIISEMNEDFIYYKSKNMILERNKIAGNLAVYENVIKRFKPYSFKIKLVDFDNTILQDFKKDLIKQGLSKPTINQYLRTLRAIYNKSVQKYKLHNEKPFEGIFKGLNIKSFESKKKYILKEDIRKLENYNALPGEQIMIDMFLLQFYFGGCDLIDLYFLTQKNFVRDRVYFERGKTNTQTLIDLKVHPKAAAILEKYKNDTNYIFPFRKDLDGYKTFRTRYAKLLKKVQQNLAIDVRPMGGNLSIKVVRHTFANIAKNLELDPDLLRELMGHERNDVDNYYKDKFPEKKRDEALYMIID